MKKYKNPIRRNPLVQHVKRQKLRYIAVLPSLITLLNAICGFVAIAYTARGSGFERGFLSRPVLSYYAFAGYMVFLAMVADMLDGRVARLSKSTSSFGGQLDSLSDAISFGVAPAFLMLKLFETSFMPIVADAAPFIRLAGRLVWVSAVVYVCCAVIRLARFNVENEEDESSHMSFSGLPSPAAAGAVVSVVIFQQDFLSRLAARSDIEFFKTVEYVIPFVLPLITLAAALLMVSRVRYPHVVNRQFRGKKPFMSLIWIVLAMVFVLWNLQLTLMAVFLGFAVWGFGRWFFLKITGRLAPPVQPTTDERQAETPQTESRRTETQNPEG